MAYFASARNTGPASAGAGHTAVPARTRRTCVPLLQTGPATRRGQVVPSLVNEVLAAQGEALDAESRSHFSSRFGHDFSRVRVHTDAKAQRSAAAVEAQAYTVGRHIVFSDGLRPTRAADRALLAHELSHVVQQDFAEAPTAALAIGPEGDTLEREADRAAAYGTSGANAGGPAVPSIRLGLQRSAGPILQRAKEKPTCETDQATLPYRFNFESSADGSWARKLFQPVTNGLGGDIKATRKIAGLGRLYGFLKLYTCDLSDVDTFEFPADGKYHRFDFPELDNKQKYTFLVGKKTGTGTIQGDGFIL
jgi:hypothetical protein